MDICTKGFTECTSLYISLALMTCCLLMCADAVTIVLFKVLGAFSNIPFDPNLDDDQRHVTAEAVS